MPTVLIIDDESAYRARFGSALRASGYRVVCAGDGVEALQMLKLHSPDLILLDLAMPWMDGIKLLAEMRWAQVGRCPVIVVSNDTSAPTARVLADFGVASVIGKPGLETQDLLEQIRRQLEPPVQAA
jgi:CheY-like chemotaxis protein